MWRRDFERIIPSHLDGPIAAGPKEFAHAIDIALTTDGYSQFGDDVKTLEAIEKLSRDIKSLEEPRPLSDPSPIRYYEPPSALLGRAHGGGCREHVIKME